MRTREENGRHEEFMKPKIENQGRKGRHEGSMKPKIEDQKRKRSPRRVHEAEK